MVRARPDAQAARRAATRDQIIRAGTRLFETQGYTATSIRDISEAAGVAARTIYLHFNSKAAILLAYFDDWIDHFVAAVCAGPPEENIDDAVNRAYTVLDATGRVDNRTIADMGVPHPVIELFSSSNLDIPGHVLQGWVRAQDTLTDHFTTSTAKPADVMLPRIKAAAIFATWMVTLLSYRDTQESPDDSTTSNGPLHDIAFATLRRFSSGLNHPKSQPSCPRQVERTD